ncbi:MAG: ABC transporter ATP-binding protein [Alphaproteobacteria bacterium]
MIGQAGSVGAEGRPAGDTNRSGAAEKGGAADFSPILKADRLSKSFRGLQAVSGYDLDLREGEILGIIGPNGAGKTTIFHLLTGFLKPTAGRIVYRGHDITGAPAPRVTRLGLARTFQNIRLFEKLTVLDNMTVAAQLHTGYSFPEILAGWPSFWRKERRIRNESLELLALLDLADQRDRRVDGLAYGDKRRLEIARALATRPKVLLLDEPAAGMNPHESDQLHESILVLRRDFALTVILVEHDMRLVMNLCERIQALNYGEVIAEGVPEEVRQHPGVIESYLGTSATTLAGAH